MKELLKFMTCGSVDDGKSTLIGCILYEGNLISDDQKESLYNDSKNAHLETRLDYSLLLDGLDEEREQGITIDVSYKFFETEKRSFIVADTPGHEEYTRNMAVGASFAELAVILINVTLGVREQTERHIRICHLMGIEKYIFVVNKMDLVDYNKEIYEKISDELKQIIKDLNIDSFDIIPTSAALGDNVIRKSNNMLWYDGYTLIDLLNSVEVNRKDRYESFCMPIQRVCRPNSEFRGYQGQVESGIIRLGDQITVLPSFETSIVESIFVSDKKSKEALFGQPITLTLNKDVDISRGCVITNNEKICSSNRFDATVFWMDKTPPNISSEYIIKIGTSKAFCKIKTIICKINISNGKHINVSNINKNEIALCKIELNKKVPLDIFNNHNSLGRFILIDTISNMTSACGTVNRIDNFRTLSHDYLYNQRAITIWMTGLSGSGKTTLAYFLKNKLMEKKRCCVVLDGDIMRETISKDLGFSKNERVENIKRIAQIARVLNKEGIITICSTMSPYKEQREIAKQIIGSTNYYEMYVSTPLEVCIERDSKGLYEGCRRGIIKELSGVDSKYEIPEGSDFVVQTENKAFKKLDEIVNKILDITSSIN